MKTIRTRCTTAVVILALAAFATVGTALVRAQSAEPKGTVVKVAHAVTEEVADPIAAIYYAIAITVGISCLSAGYAVGKVGAAALGAAAEKPELLGRAIIFVGLAEGIAIYGLIIGIMLILKL